jgi:Cupin superfamily protein
VVYNLLDTLVASVPSFLSGEWGSEPTISRSHELDPKNKYPSPDVYLRNILNLLDSQALAPPYLRIVRPGERAAPSELWSEDGKIGKSPAKRLKWQGVLDELRKGSSLILDDFQEHSPEARMACRELASELSIPFYATLFITPPGQQGLHLHIDNKEVFALQLAGQKMWNVYKQLRPVPAQSRVIVDDLSSETPGTWKIGKGDCLYIPAGAPHLAFAVQGQISVHLSFVGSPLYWSDLIHRLIGEILKGDEFLGTAPSGPNPGSLYPDVMKRIDKLRDRLTDSVKPGGLDSVIQERWRASLPDGRVATLLENLLAIAEPGIGNLHLELSREAQVTYSGSESDEPVVRLAGRKFKVPEVIHPLLPKLIAGPVPVTEIVGAVGDDRARQIVAELVRHGIATTVTDAASSQN